MWLDKNFAMAKLSLIINYNFVTKSYTVVDINNSIVNLPLVVNTNIFNKIRMK